MSPFSSIHQKRLILNVMTLVFRATADMEELAVALRLEKVVVASTGGGAPYALGVASFVEHRVQGMLLISPVWSAGAPVNIRADNRVRQHGFAWDRVQSMLCIRPCAPLQAALVQVLALRGIVKRAVYDLLTNITNASGNVTVQLGLVRRSQTLYAYAPSFQCADKLIVSFAASQPSSQHRLRGSRCRFPPPQRT